MNDYIQIIGLKWRVLLLFALAGLLILALAGTATASYEIKVTRTVAADGLPVLKFTGHGWRTGEVWIEYSKWCTPACKPERLTDTTDTRRPSQWSDFRWRLKLQPIDLAHADFWPRPISNGTGSVTFTQEVCHRKDACKHVKRTVRGGNEG